MVGVVWSALDTLIAQNADSAAPDVPEVVDEPNLASRIDHLEVSLPEHLVGSVGFPVTVEALDAQGQPVDVDLGGLVLSSTDLNLRVPENTEFAWKDGAVTIEGVTVRGGPFQFGRVRIAADAGAAHGDTISHYIPGLATLLPSILAIVLALITREVLLSLFLGTWIGATALGNGNPLAGFAAGLGYLVSSLADHDHASVILFTLTIGGMIGLINRTGGTGGLVATLRRLARTARSGQLTTFGMGALVFFDDYASLLLTGSTMRAVTDRLRVSREKLSFIVDATAAPVANIALISTWVGYELSLIAKGFEPYPDANVSPLTVFVASIPYRFYPLLMLAFIVIMAATLRDFGPMFTAEMRTRRSGRVLRPGASPAAKPEGATIVGDHTPQYWWNAVIPIVVMMGAVAIGLYMSGRASLLETAALDPSALQPPFKLWDVYGEADSFQVLIVSSVLGALAAGVLALGQRLLSFRDTMHHFVEGAKSITPALLILVLAWSLAAVTEQLQAAEYLASFTQGSAAAWVPLIVFVLAAGMSFATGTAWGTMALLTPITIQFIAQLPVGPDPSSPIMLAGVGAVLGGATVGDHISPISDTTIMSSMSCGADHIDHVRTQLPYAVAVAAVCIVFGYVAVALGVPVGLALIGGIVGVGAIIFVFGKRTDPQAVLAAIRLDVTSGDRARRIEALDELSSMAGSPLAMEVVRLLDDGDEQVQIHALRALGRMRHAAAREAVESRLDSPNRHIRATAVKALSQLGGGAAVLPQILARLDDDDHRVRANAVEAISHLDGQLPKEAIDALVRSTLDEDNRVRATAAMVLWQRTRDEAHLNHLITMVRGGTKRAALSAIHALSEVDSNFAVRVLREAVSASEHPEVQAAAVQALEQLEASEDTTPGEPPPQSRPDEH